MIKAFWRVMSDICWKVGAERLAMKFLFMSLETLSDDDFDIDIEFEPLTKVPVGPYELKVIYEDKDLIKELGDMRNNDIMIPRTIHDIN